MDTNQSLEFLRNEFKQALSLANEAAAAARIYELVLLEEDSQRDELSKLMAEQLLQGTPLPIRKSILAALFIFGIDGRHFAGVQNCLLSKDNDAFMAWRLLAQNAKNDGAADYVRANKEAFTQGLKDSDPQIREAAIQLLAVTRDSHDLKLIAEMLLDNTPSVRNLAFNVLMNSGENVKVCSEQFDSYLRHVDTNCKLPERISELHIFAPKLAESPITLPDATPILSILRKTEALGHHLLKDSLNYKLYELIGHCAAQGAENFPMLKERALKNLNFQNVRACIWLAQRCPEYISDTLEVIDNASRYGDEGMASQAISDMQFLGKSTRRFIPRLLELMADLEKGWVRAAAAKTLGFLIDKEKDSELIELLINYLQDKNDGLIQGACEALGQIYAGDNNVAAEALSAIAEIANRSTYQMQTVGTAIYTKITGQAPPKNDAGANIESEAKRAFEGLRNADPFVVMESLTLLRYRPDMRSNTLLAGKTEFIPLLWEFAFETPERFNPLDKHWSKIEGLRLAALEILQCFGPLAASYAPRLLQIVKTKYVNAPRLDKFEQAVTDTLAFVGTNTPEVLAFFEEELRKDNGSEWASPLAKMGAEGAGALISILYEKTAKLQKLAASDPISKLMTGTQQHICYLLAAMGQKALPAVPTLIFIALDKAHESETVRMCGGHHYNNRSVAVQTLCKLAPDDAQVVAAFEEIKKDKWLYSVVQEELARIKQLESEQQKPQDLVVMTKEFFDAITQGDCDKLKSLLKAGVDVNSKLVPQGHSPENCDTALITAVRRKKPKILQILIDCGADLNAKGHSFQDPISVACECADFEGVTRLLKSGSQVSYPPLSFAGIRGEFELAMILLLAGQDPNTGLAVAAEYGRLRIVEELLIAGADPDIDDGVAIKKAVAKGHLQIVAALNATRKKSKKDPDLLISAVKNGKFDVALLLLRAGEGKDLRNDFASECMHKSISSAQCEIVAEMLNSGVDANIRDRNATTPLMQAARVGSLEICKNLVAHGADANLTDASGSTALLAAIEGGNIELLAFIMSLDMQLDKKKDSGRALCIASRQGRVEMLHHLLGLGFDVNGIGDYGGTALHYPHSPEIVEILVAAGADLEARNPHGETPLITTAGGANAEILSTLISAGADVNAVQNWGDTALSRAKGHNQQKLVKVLEAAGAQDRGPRVESKGRGSAVLMTVPSGRSASSVPTPPVPPATPASLTPAKPLLPPPPPRRAGDPNPSASNLNAVPPPAVPEVKAEQPAIVPRVCQTVISITFPGHGTTGLLKELFEAANTNDSLKAKEIIAAGCPANSADNERRTPLMWAAAGNRLEVAEVLLDAGADPNCHRADGTTALQWAIQNVCEENTRMVEFLLSRGADVNLSGTFTPLAEAVRKKTLATVRVLLKAGAEIDTPAHRMSAPLCFAVDTGSLEIVKLLIEWKANPNVYDKHGYTPLLRAVKYKEIFAYLLANGADPDLPAAGFMGAMQTPFLRAAADGCVETLQLLLQLKCKPDIDQRNSNGETALMLAAHNGHPEVVKLLLSEGADLWLTNSKRECALILAQKNDGQTPEKQTAKYDCAKLILAASKT